MNKFIAILFFISAAVTGCGTTQPEDPTNVAGPVPATQSAETDVLAMGDWGEDTAAQRTVAAAIAKEVRDRHINPTAMLLLGDNFYFKLTGPNDPRWQSVFEQVYDQRVLSEPFYACLGNHDYDGNNLQAEFRATRSKKSAVAFQASGGVVSNRSACGIIRW